MRYQTALRPDSMPRLYRDRAGCAFDGLTGVQRLKARLPQRQQINFGVPARRKEGGGNWRVGSLHPCGLLAPWIGSNPHSDLLRSAFYLLTRTSIRPRRLSGTELNSRPFDVPVDVVDFHLPTDDTVRQDAPRRERTVNYARGFAFSG